MLEKINDIKFITDPGISIEIKDFFLHKQMCQVLIFLSIMMNTTLLFT